MLAWASRHKLPLIIFSVSFLVRFVYLVATSGSPLFQTHIADALYHEEWAKRILDGDLFSLRMDGVLYKAPLYPYFLALGTWLSGTSNFFPMFLQVLMMAGSCALLFLIARGTLGEAAAFIGALIFSFYFPSIYFSAEMEIPALAIFLTLLSTYLFFLDQGRLSRIGAALCLGLSALALPSNLLLLPLFALRLVKKAPGRRLGLKRAGLALALTIATILPCTLRNLVAGGHLTFISANGGINAYIGNNPGYDRTVYLRPGYAFEDFYDEPRRVAGVQSIADRDRYWYAKTLAFISEHPGQEALLLGKKLGLYFANYEIARNTDIPYAKQTSIYRHIPFVPAWLILAAGVAGLVVAGRKDVWLAVLGALLALPCLVFFVTDRYRFPSMAIWALFAGAFVAAMADWLRRGQGNPSRRVFLLSLAAAACVAGVSNLNLFVVKNQVCRPPLVLAFAYEAQGRHPQALQEYSTALALAQAEGPRDVKTEAEILCRRGNLRMSMGDLEAARDDFEKALAVDPGSGPAYSYLGSLYAQEHQSELAAKMFGRALDLNPWDVVSLHNFALLLLGDNRLDEAMAKLKRVIELAPEHAAAHSDLASLHGAQGRYDLMEAEAKLAVHYDPRLPVARYNLAKAYLATGRTELAVTEYLTVAQTAPAEASQAYNQLGVLLAEKNDLPQAITYWQKALEIDPKNRDAYLNLLRAKAMLR